MSAELNAPQRRAVQYLDGPLLVLAGAGSGKTRVITHKIAHLVGECGYPPGHVAAITFTNKAAREMQERVARLVQGRSLRGLTVCTFHALGLEIVRAEAALLDYKPRFSILDAADSGQILTEILKTSDKAVLRQTRELISQWKNRLIPPERTEPDTPEAKTAALAYARYQETLKSYQAVDFDDLIGLPARLFETHPEALARWRSKIRYLLVDEYQDTNAAQFCMVRQLAGLSGALTAVGDDNQAIYGWRGADAENMRLLQQAFPRLEVIKLEQNYRSSQHILGCANHLIGHNPKLFDKRLWSDIGRGDLIRVTAAADERREAETVVMRLQSIRLERRAKFSDFAVLYRSNYQARAIEEVLRAEQIPYRLTGGTSFFERTEIKDLIAYLRLIANGDDDPAFIRAVTTPKRGVGPQTLEQLGRYAARRQNSLFTAAFEAGFQHVLPAKQLDPLVEFCEFINRMEHRARREPAPQVLEDLLAAIGYEAYLFDTCEPRQAQGKWDNVLQFCAWLNRKAEEGQKTLVQLTQTLALLSILDRREDESEAVQLSTLHAAKGLEFRYVFLVGVEEGLLPHREAIDAGTLEEERRLLYVGITRAQDSLTLSYCLKRKRGREWEAREPSRFLAELGEQGVQTPVRELDPSQQKAQAATRLAQLRTLLDGR